MFNIRYVAAPLLVACAFFLFFTAGCAAPRFERTDLLDTPETQVLLTRIIADGNVESLGFDHPWYVEEVTLDAILANVTYHYISMLGEKKPIAAFPRVMRQALVPYLVQAFSKATMDEMVYFAYVGSETFLYIAGKNYFTNGVMFVKNNKLNIAFRYISLEGVDRLSDVPGAWRMDPRKKPQTMGWILNEGPGMTLVRPDTTGGLFALKQYSNWIRIDLDQQWKTTHSFRRKKKHSSGTTETYRSIKTSPEPKSKGSGDDDVEGIIIRPPKGYFSIKSYPEMKPE